MAEAREKNRYRYNGGVMIYDRVVADHFKAETWAVSPKKAANNIVFQYKKKCNVAPHIPVRLTSDIRLTE